MRTVRGQGAAAGKHDLTLVVSDKGNGFCSRPCSAREAPELSGALPVADSSVDECALSKLELHGCPDTPDGTEYTDETYAPRMEVNIEPSFSSESLCLHGRLDGAR